MKLSNAEENDIREYAMRAIYDHWAAHDTEEQDDVIDAFIADINEVLDKRQLGETS